MKRKKIKRKERKKDKQGWKTRKAGFRLNLSLKNEHKMAQLSSSPKGYCAGTRSRFFTWRGSPGGLHHATRYSVWNKSKKQGKKIKNKDKIYIYRDI